MSSSRTAAIAALVMVGCGGGERARTENLQTALAYDGSMKIVGTTAAGPASLEVSATILPKLWKELENGTKNEGLYAHEGANYPRTYEEAEQVVREVSMPYADLLVQCAALHPEIVLESSGQTLTQEQLWANQEAVSRCAYLDFAIKPYWIPQLVNDVDICAVVFGDGWHLPTELELLSFSDEARQAAMDAFGTEVFGNLEIFTRAGNGSLVIGSIAPGARTLKGFNYPQGVYAEPQKNHYEGGTALRCLRAGSAIP